VLTHQGLSTLSPLKSVVHVRDLLMAANVLPQVDRHLLLFEDWLAGWLAQITDPENRKVLHQYATWQVLRRLRATATDGPIGHYRAQNARRGLRVAAAFLEHLTSIDTTLAECRQGDLDRWFAHATRGDRRDLRSFLGWAIRTRRMPRLTMPPTLEPPPNPPGGAVCRRECWPHPGCDFHVVVIGVEVGHGAVEGGAVRADQTRQAGRTSVDPGPS
jgi:hypothetical protein